MSYWTMDELEGLLTGAILQYGKKFPEKAGDYELTTDLLRERLYGRLEVLAALLGCEINTVEGAADLHHEIDLAREFVARVPQSEDVDA